MRSIFGIDHRSTPDAKAKEVEGVTAVQFQRTNGAYTGTVHDTRTNQVYELTQVRFGWVLLDEWCIEHFGLTVRHAILKARAANR
jgi:hypothetical protein